MTPFGLSDKNLIYSFLRTLCSTSCKPHNADASTKVCGKSINLALANFINSLSHLYKVFIHRGLIVTKSL